MKNVDSQPSNPFPGLRPFRSDEHHLFFGREEQTAALLQLLRTNRFLAVVGTSGSGKSSLVRAGMIAELHGGTMTQAGSTWEVMILRPGGSPVENLARAFVDADLYDAQDASTLPRLLATLSRSRFGLVEAMKQSEVFEPGTNLLVVVDQFEELFRFRQQGVDSEEAAAAFVNLLLTASQQTERPIYVTITMRSDYLGDCSEIPGLAEAVNDGEYLIPRLLRDQKRDAIEKPIGVGGAKISPLLVQRLLNDVGDDPDQLPVLQHALMRMWDVWCSGSDPSRPIEFSDFEATGGLGAALSNHADEIYDSLQDDHHRHVCEKIFKTLTEKGEDNRGIRRPTRLGRLQAISSTDRDTVTTVLDAFRAPGVTFLMPGTEGDLHDKTVLDLSHESLMRGWQRLRGWVEEEAQSARIFRRLLDTARLWSDGNAGLFRDPDLQIGLSWREQEGPNAEWAELYGGNFDSAIAFLEASNADVQAERQAKDAARQRELKQAQQLAEVQQLRLEQQQRAAGKLRKVIGGLAVVAIIAVVACIAALFANQRANSLALQAQQNEERALRNEAQVKEALDVVAAQKTEVEGSLVKAQAAERAARAAEEAGEAEREKAVRHYYFAKMAQMNESALDGTGFDLLDNTFRQLAGLRTSRPPFAWEWHYLRSLTRQDEMTLHGHTVDGYNLAWSPDGAYLASGGSDNCIRIWDAATGRAILSFPAPWGIYALAWSPDGRRLASGGGHAGHHLTIWNPWTGEKMAQCGRPEQAIHAVAWDSTGNRLASVGDDNTVRVWSGATGRELASRAVAGCARALAWRPTGGGWTYGDAQGAVHVWDEVPDTDTTLLPGDGVTVDGLAWSPDGAHLALESSQSLVRVWRIADRTPLFESQAAAGRQPESAIAWSHDGLLLSTREGTLIHLIDVTIGQRVMTLAGQQKVPQGLAWSPRERRLASISGGWNGDFKIWNLAQNKAPRRTLPIQATGRGVVESIAWSPDGSKLAIAANDQTARVWDLEKSCELAALKGHQKRVTAVGWSPQGNLLASGDAGGTIRLWSGKSFEELQRLELDTGIWWFNWTPQGDRLLSPASHLKARLWDTSRTSDVRPVLDFPGRFSVLRPDGQVVVVGGSYALKLFDVQSGKELSSIATPNQHPLRATWSPNGKKFAMDFSPQVLVFDAEQRRLLFALDGHLGDVYSIAWSPDGARLATGGSDQKIRLWDAESGTAVCALRGHKDEVRCVTWSPDGTQLASADVAGAVMIWDAREGYRFDQSPQFAPALDERLAADPTDAHAWRLRARVRARAGDWDRAAEDFRQLAALGAEASPRWFNTGWWTVDDYDPRLAPDPFLLENSPEQRGGRPHWHPAGDDPNGYVPLPEPLATLVTRVYAIEDCEVALCQNTSSWVKGWCNGQSFPTQQRQMLKLRRGWNVVAAWIAVETPRPNAGVYLRFSDRPYDMAQALLADGRPAQALVMVNNVLKSGESEIPLAAFTPVLSLAGAGLAAAGDFERAAAAYVQAFDQTVSSTARMTLANTIAQWEPVSAEVRRLRPQAPQIPAARAAVREKAGDVDKAAAERQIALPLYEQALAEQPDDAALAAELAQMLLEAQSKWTVLEPVEMTSAGGAKLRKLADNSILASGANPRTDTYRIVTAADVPQVVAVRLEALTHESLPAQGPGRDDVNDRGNFAMIRWQVASASPSDPQESTQLEFDAVFTDHDHPRAPAEPQGHWNVSQGTGKVHWAVFSTPRPVAVSKESPLTFEMLFSTNAAYPGQNLGRFRISVTDNLQMMEAEKLRLALLRGELSGFVALGAAYAIDGAPTKVSEWLAKGLETSTDVERANIIRVAMRFPKLLSALQTLHSNDLWVQTLIAEELARRGRWDEAAAVFDALAASHPEKAPPRLQTGFWVIGPFPEDMQLKEAFPPERDPDPFRAVDSLTPGGAALKWRPAPVEADGQLNLAKVFADQNHICDYSLMRVYSPQERIVAILLGSDDSVRVWVNGEVVHENVVVRGVVPDDDAFSVTLRQGWNTVLVKVSNGDGGHGLCLRLSDQPRDLALAQADTHGKKGQWRDVIEILSPAIEQWPEDVEILVLRARSYHRLGQWDAAIADWSRALELKPEASELRTQRAHAYQDSKQWDLALADWTQLAESRENPWYLRMQGMCLDELGRWEEALTVHNRAVELETVSPWAMLHFRGLHYARRGEWRKATEDLSQALENLPKNTDWSIAQDLALAALMAGDGDAHRKAIAQLDERTGENASANQAMWLALVSVLAPNAVTDINRDRLLEVASRSEPSWRTPLTAAIHFRLGEFQEADRLFGEEPGGPEFQFLAAMVKHRLGDHQGAKAWLTRGTDWMQKRLDENPDRSIPKEEWWGNWALKWVLWKEAEGLIKDPRPMPKSDRARHDASEVDQFKPE